MKEVRQVPEMFVQVQQNLVGTERGVDGRPRRLGIDAGFEEVVVERLDRLEGRGRARLGNGGLVALLFEHGHLFFW